MKLCEYGCGKEAQHQFKNGKWCCEEHYLSCSNMKNRLIGENNPSKRIDVRIKKSKKLMGHVLSDETKRKISKSHKGKISPRKGIILTIEQRKVLSNALKGRSAWNKGKSHSEETRRKMSEARKKRITSDETRKKLSECKKRENLSTETRKKISEAVRGRTCSEETKRRMSEIAKGRKHSEETRKRLSEIAKRENLSAETRRKMSEWQRGNKNTQWKGGISCEPYCPLWSDKEYKQSIKERDENKCLNPEGRNHSERLTIHHINYDKKDCRPLNLITLCNSCNTKANKDREWHKYWYEAIVLKRYRR